MAVNFIAPLGGPTALPTLVMVLTQSLEGRPHHHMGQDKQRGRQEAPLLHRSKEQPPAPPPPVFWSVACASTIQGKG